MLLYPYFTNSPMNIQPNVQSSLLDTYILYYEVSLIILLKESIRTQCDPRTNCPAQGSSVHCSSSTETPHRNIELTETLFTAERSTRLLLSPLNGWARQTLHGRVDLRSTCVLPSTLLPLIFLPLYSLELTQASRYPDPFETPQSARSAGALSRESRSQLIT